MSYFLQGFVRAAMIMLECSRATTALLHNFPIPTVKSGVPELQSIEFDNAL